MQSHILDQLRRGTSDVHEHLDRSLPLAADELDPNDYVRLLAAFRDIQADADRALAPHAADMRGFGYDVTGRHEVEWLDADLAWWRENRGIAPESAQASQTRSLSALPAIDSTFAAFGCVYVLEGSTLGGQVILRHIEKSLRLVPPQGCRYFTSYGDDVGPRWRRTCQSLDAIAATASASQIDIMVATARALFAHFDASLNQALV